MKQETTAHLGLPLPHPNNCLEDDVLHLRAALQGMDAALHSINTTTTESVQQMIEDLSEQITSSASALQNSIEKISPQLASTTEDITEPLLNFWAHYKMLNGSPEAISILLDPGVTPETFSDWLAEPGKLPLFEQLMAAHASMGSVAANATAMAAVAASSTAMAAVAASSTAMAAVRVSAVALSAINASQPALDALYAAATKFNHAGGSWSANPLTIVNGNFLLVRITTKGNPAGWNEGAYAGDSCVKIGGALFTTTTGMNNGTSNISARAANPYIQDNAARPVDNTSLTCYLYNPTEIAYLAA